MTAPSFTYSGNVYTGAAAGTVDFALTSTTGNPIAYLEPSHIHVYKSSNQGSTWTELTRPAQWDFVTSGTVARLVTGIAAGDWVKVQRITPSSPAYVTFQSSSLLTAEQLNDDTLFNTYLNQERSDQGDQSTLTANSASTAAASATTTANAATTTANTALSTANTALSTANTASSNASAAVTTANTASTNATAAVATAGTASTNASAAVATANTASTNASSAVTTANTASSDASTALSTANTALSTANTALSTANSAATDATAAVATANTAASDASAAVSTANTASTDATNAVTTANAASTNASSAVTTANTADSKADQAIAAVANALLFTIVANVAAIPGSPNDGDAIEITDSTGIESFTPLTGLPSGFVGDSGLGVRLTYQASSTSWVWLQYFPQDPDNRYAGPNTNAGTVTAPSIAFGPTDTNTGIYSPGADEIGLVTGGSARLTIDSSGGVAVPGTADGPQWRGCPGHR